MIAREMTYQSMDYHISAPTSLPLAAGDRPRLRKAAKQEKNGEKHKHARNHT